jgi:CDP-diacylglycerol---glycerol-3-phosphate 3-phosphatidyltransferase
MATLYQLKPRFQGLLRPLTERLADAGVTANQVTLGAAGLSVALGALLSYAGDIRPLFLLLPLFLFIRMALNAIDGMLAREHRQASRLGQYLNELCDVVSDAALALPFLFVAPFQPWAVLGFIFVSFLAEFAGVLGQAAGVGRNYAGPLGKSDRAFGIGALGVLVGFGIDFTEIFLIAFPLLTLLALATVANRVRLGVQA